MQADYLKYDGLGLAELVKRREVQPRELVDAALARIAQTNPGLGYMVRTLEELAYRQADATPDSDGAFVGVPFVLKDLLQSVAGVVTEGGSRFFQGVAADRDSELYERYRAAGLVLVGKSKTPEFGLLPVTEPETQGPCRNPHDRTRTSGGSSGGSAVAVAVGAVPIAHASDGGGSIRIPASCCGLFALKPSRGRLPPPPYAGQVWGGLVVDHVITRSVRDSAAMLDATAAPSAFAPYVAPAFERTCLDEVKEPRKKRLRIGFYTESPLFSSIDPVCIRAVEETARKLEDLGHHVEEVRPGFEQESLTRAFFTVIASNLSAEIAMAEKMLGREAKHDSFETETWLLKELGEMFTAAEFGMAQRVLEVEAKRLVHRLGDYDMTLTPTLGKKPLTIGATRAKGALHLGQELLKRTRLRAPLRWKALLEPQLKEVFDFIPFTPLANFTGQPSMNVPVYWHEGLPIGTMLTGRYGEEGKLFSLASELEAQTRWHERFPL